MNTKTLWIVLGSAAVGLVLGAAYGPVIPGVKQVSRMLPGSKAL